MSIVVLRQSYFERHVLAAGERVKCSKDSGCDVKVYDLWCGRGFISKKKDARGWGGDENHSRVCCRWPETSTLTTSL